MSRRFVVSALTLTFALPVLLGAAQSRAAEDILKLVPESALGFVVVNRLDAVDAKLQQLGHEMQLPMPGLLTLLRTRGGVRAGLDEKGTAALLVLPPGGGMPWPTPIVLVPVTDYAAFLAQFKSEETGAEVTKIEVWGSQLWIRKVGGYAALTDASHRETIEKHLKLSQKVPEALSPWKAWLAEKDAAAVILQPGIKLLSAQVQAGMQMMKASMAQAGEQGRQAAAVFDIYGKLFQAAEKEVASVGVGLRFDGQGTLHVAKRARLVPGGSWARLASHLKPAKENLLAGLPAGPFVLAGGGTLPQEIWDPLMKFSMDMMKSMSSVYGLKEDEIDQMPKAAMESMKHVRGMSMVLGVWPSGTSLYSRTVAIMRVDKSDAYMAEYETALKEFGEFARKADSPILAPMEVEKTQIDGAAALQITTKVPKPPAAQQVPQYDKMMEAFFGPGKKLVAWATPVDERTVVLGYVDREHLQRTIRTIKQGKPGLAADPEVARTTALLPSGAPWVAVWSPRGTIDLVKRTINAFAPDGDKAGGKIPEFPATPPIGLALTTAPNELQGHLVVPAEIFKAIGQYAARVKPRGEGRGGKEGEKTCAVRGEVRLDGKSLPAPARIRFVAAAEADSRAFSVKDGKFEGRLKAGQYRVSFRAASVPEKYRAPATSGLTVEVKEGQNVFEFDLR